MYCIGITEVMGLNGGVYNKWLNSISSLGKIAAEVHNFFKNKLKSRFSVNPSNGVKAIKYTE